MELSTENIAKLNLFIQSKDGLTNLMDIENLIVIEKDAQTITEFKASATRLNKQKIKADPTITDIWDNLLKEQIVYSVNKIKRK